jgi:hypothetical protein
MFTRLPIIVLQSNCLKILIGTNGIRTSVMSGQAKISAFFQRGSAPGNSIKTQASGSAGTSLSRSPLKTRIADNSDSTCTSKTESLKRQRDENDDENEKVEAQVIAEKVHVAIFAITFQRLLSAHSHGVNLL